MVYNIPSLCSNKKLAKMTPHFFYINLFLGSQHRPILLFPMEKKIGGRGSKGNNHIYKALNANYHPYYIALMYDAHYGISNDNVFLTILPHVRL